MCLHWHVLAAVGAGSCLACQHSVHCSRGAGMPSQHLCAGNKPSSANSLACMSLPQACLRLKGENGIMRKKFQALQKDIEEQREQLTLQHEQQKGLYNTIKGDHADLAPWLAAARLLLCCGLQRPVCAAAAALLTPTCCAVCSRPPLPPHFPSTPW